MTLPHEVPEIVARMLSDSIEDYEQLETLALLVRDRSRFWTPERIAVALNMDAATAEHALEHLRRCGLLRVDQTERASTYFFDPSEPRLADAAKKLADHYTMNRIAVIKLMNANAIARVRGNAARAFADAFVVKKRNDE